MKTFKSVFNALVVAVSLGSSVSAVAVMVAGPAPVVTPSTDTRVVLGHRVNHSGQEELVYAVH
jgi:hypothetical protein